MANTIDRQTVAKQVARSDYDTGSVQLQVVAITDRIRQLSEHLKKFKKDYSSKSGLLKLIAQRRTFMKYIAREDEKSYKLLTQYIDIKK